MDGRGNALLQELPGTRLAGMVSVAFYDTEPADIDREVMAAYQRAFVKLVPGAWRCVRMLHWLVQDKDAVSQQSKLGQPVVAGQGGKCKRSATHC